MLLSDNTVRLLLVSSGAVCGRALAQPMFSAATGEPLWRECPIGYSHAKAHRRRRVQARGATNMRSYGVDAQPKKHGIAVNELSSSIREEIIAGRLVPGQRLILRDL